MQALSLAVHIPIVCFGIAFPAMILFVHGLYLRTGEPHYKALAKRWSKVALILFAVGVVTGTILSLRVRAAVARLHGHVRRGLRARVRRWRASRSSSRRSSSRSTSTAGTGCRARTHFLTGIPVVIAGFAGSFNVIAVNGWMNHPTGLRRRRRPGRRPAAVDGAAQREHVARADPHVPGRLHRRGLHRRRRVRARAAARQARRVPPHRRSSSRSASPRSPRPRRSSSATGPGAQVAENQPVKLAAIEGLPTTTEGAPFTIGGWYDDDANEIDGGIEIPKLLSLLADHDPNATVQGLDTVPPDDRPPVNIVRYAFQIMVGIGTLLALLGAALRAHAVAPAAAAAARRGSTARVMVAGPLALVALIAGWITTEVGRQPWIVYEVMRVEDAVTQQRRPGARLRACSSRSTSLLAAAVAWLLRRLAAHSRPSARWCRADGRDLPRAHLRSA